MTSFPLQQSPKPSFKRIKPTAAQRGLINHSTRKKLLERSQGLCERCGKGGQPLEAAHTLRRWRIEGRTTIADLAHLCQPCHFFSDNTSAGRHWLTQFRNKVKEISI